MRTDISEDSKGDPSKALPQPPLRRDDGVEPLLPKEDLDAAPSVTSGDSQDGQKTDADRKPGD